MKKVTSKQIFTGVLVACVALCMLVYLMVFTKYNDEKDMLVASNNSLQTQVDELKGYYDERTTYRTNTANMTKSIADMTLDYAGDAREEDFIMTAVAMQDAAVINYEKINIDEEEAIHTIPVEVVTGAKIEGYENEIEFVEKKASYANITDYKNLKLCVEEIYKNDYRVGIDALVYKRESDSNNFIRGTIDVTYYSIHGMNKPYEFPKMDNYLTGGEDQDLFAKLLVDEDDEASSDEE